LPALERAAIRGRCRARWRTLRTTAAELSGALLCYLHHTPAWQGGFSTRAGQPTLTGLSTVDAASEPAETLRRWERRQARRASALRGRLYSGSRRGGPRSA